MILIVLSVLFWSIVYLFTRCVKKFSQAAVNRKRKMSHCSAPKHLKLHDFITKKRDKLITNPPVNLKVGKSVSCIFFIIFLCAMTNSKLQIQLICKPMVVLVWQWILMEGKKDVWYVFGNTRFSFRMHCILDTFTTCLS